MAAVVVYDSGGGIWIWIGGIWQRWWYKAALVGYGRGGGIWQQRWRWCGGGVTNYDRTRNSIGLDPKTSN